jgi:hypothetical protein
MLMLHIGLLFALIAGTGPAPTAVALSPATSSVPPNPYLDWGACPFECCVYGKWRVLRRTTVLTRRQTGAPKAFQLEAGEEVTVSTGVVVTTRPGRIKVLQPVILGEAPNPVSLKPGDLIYILHYKGEGYDLLWFNGHTFGDQIHMDRLGPIQINGADALQVLELPTTDWWVKVTNGVGQVGWSILPEDFGGNDACG